MGERQKIATDTDLKRAALHKKVRAANRWYFAQRLLDLSFALLFAGCVLIAYYGHRVIAVGLLLVTLLLAWFRWRHWDDRKLASGEADIAEGQESTEWNDTPDSSSFDSSDSGGDGSGGGD